MKYCQKCGKELFDEAVFCPGCGCATGYMPKFYNTQPNVFAQTPNNARSNIYAQPTDNMQSNVYVRESDVAPIDYIAKLSKRLKINGIIWICVACVQIITVLAKIILYSDIEWFLGVVGILNFISALKDINYSIDVRTNQTGLVQRFKPIAGSIIILIYNAIYGGLIGVVGSIYYLIGIRDFVLSNQEVFSKFDTAPQTN